MKIGICTSVEHAQRVKAAGYDFVEEQVQRVLAPAVPDPGWTVPAALAESVLPVPAVNVLLPGTLRVTGPEVRPDDQRAYLERVFARAAGVGIGIVVFGSGGARKVPEGFSMTEARSQVVGFCRLAAELASPHDVTLVVEHLNRSETNILNRLSDCAAVVREVAHPACRLLVDSYHLWLEDESLDAVQENLDLIRHVHVADREGRTAPGESGQSNYRPLFRVLKRGGYDARISIEAKGFDDFEGVGPRVLSRLREDWAAA